MPIENITIQQDKMKTSYRAQELNEYEWFCPRCDPLPKGVVCNCAGKLKRPKYLKGHYFYDENTNKHHILTSTPINKENTTGYKLTEIDPDTLAINLPNMKDLLSRKTFAAFNPEGRGGDIIKDCEGDLYLLVFQEHSMQVHGISYGYFTGEHENDFDMNYSEFDAGFEIVKVHNPNTEQQ